MKVGNKVVLADIGPEMVIEEIRNDGAVTCVRYDTKDGEYKRHHFPKPEVLTCLDPELPELSDLAIPGFFARGAEQEFEKTDKAWGVFDTQDGFAIVGLKLLAKTQGDHDSTKATLLALREKVTRFSYGIAIGGLGLCFTISTKCSLLTSNEETGEHWLNDDFLAFIDSLSLPDGEIGTFTKLFNAIEQLAPPPARSRG